MQTSHSKNSKAALSLNHIRLFDNKPANNPLIGKLIHFIVEFVEIWK